MNLLPADLIFELSNFLPVSAPLLMVCRAFRAAIHRRRSVAVTVTHGRVLVGQQLVWMRRHADGVQRLRVRCAVHESVRHDRALFRTLGAYGEVRVLDLAVGATVLPLTGVVDLLERRFPVLESLSLDISFRSDTDRLDERFWTALLRLRCVELIAEKPDDIVDRDAQALGRTAVDGARWTEFRASVRQGGLTATGVAALTAALRRCPVLTAVSLDHSYGPLDDAAAALAVGPLTELPGLRRLDLILDGDGELGNEETLRWPGDLAARPMQSLTLSLAGHRIDAVAASLPHRLTRLHLDLYACIGIVDARGGWVRLGTAVGATAPTLRQLELFVAQCGLDDSALAAVYDTGIRPLGGLRTLALDLTGNARLTDAALAGVIGAIPCGVTTLRLLVNDLPSVRTLALGALSACRDLELSAGFSADALCIEPPAAVERLKLLLAESTLVGPIVFPATVRSLHLNLDYVRLLPGQCGDRNYPGPTPPTIRRLTVSVRFASAEVVRWVSGLGSSLTTEVHWTTDDSNPDVDFLARIAPRDAFSLSTTFVHILSPAMLAALRSLFARTGGGVSRFGLRLRSVYYDAKEPPGTVDLLDWIRSHLSVATTAHVTLDIDGFVPETVQSAIRRLPLSRYAAAAADGRLAPVASTTVCYSDIFKGSDLSDGLRSDRRLSSLPGVFVYEPDRDSLLTQLTGNRLFIDECDRRWR